MRHSLLTATLIGAGGFAGALLRYGLSGLVHRQFPQSTFPMGTLVVNALGCLLIGLLAGLAESRQLFGPQTRSFALIGLLGGFTTFSTFAYETLTLLRAADFARASTNVVAHVFLSLALVWVGFNLASR